MWFLLDNVILAFLQQNLDIVISCGNIIHIPDTSLFF